MAETILKDNKVGKHILPDFKTYCKTVSNQDSDRHISQWNRTKSRNNPLHLWPVGFAKGIQWGKDGLSNKWCQNNCLY